MKIQPEIKFVIFENGVLKREISKKCIEGSLVQSLEDFRRATNEILTNMIEESGDSSDVKIDEIEEADSSSDDETDIPQMPKKKRN